MSADYVPHDGPGAVLWHEEQKAARPADEPLRPGQNPLADQLIEENARLRRERNGWMHEAERIKREYDNLVASLGDLIHNCNTGECIDGE